MIDARLQRSVNLADAPPELAQAFADQADWDPRHARALPANRGDGYTYLCLLPERIQVWRNAPEHPGYDKVKVPVSWTDGLALVQLPVITPS
jgi:hypothetical protein